MVNKVIEKKECLIFFVTFILLLVIHFYLILILYLWYGAASIAKPGRMGYAWEAILHGSRDPCVGHRMFCATEDCEGRCAKVSTLSETNSSFSLKKCVKILQNFNCIGLLERVY